MNEETQYTDLVILPCHSIWTPGETKGVSREEWALAPFQIDGNDHLCFREHLAKSIDVLMTNARAALVISGGQTKKESGPILESYSYYQLGHAMLPQEMKQLKERVILEEYARDSFENVLFLICRFYEVFGQYPASITVVGFEFKRDRFVEQHLQQALLLPVGRSTYIGNSPEPQEVNDLHRSKYFEELNLSEKTHAQTPFKSDWYGIREPLSTKKVLRDPFRRSHGYSNSNPKLREFLGALETADSSTSSEILRDLLPASLWNATGQPQN